MSIGYRFYLIDSIDVYKLIELLDDPRVHDTIKKLIDTYGTLNGIIYFLDSFTFDKDILSVLKALGIVSEIDGKIYLILPNLKILKNVYEY